MLVGSCSANTISNGERLSPRKIPLFIHTSPNIWLPAINSVFYCFRLFWITPVRFSAKPDMSLWHSIIHKWGTIIICLIIVHPDHSKAFFKPSAIKAADLLCLVSFFYILSVLLVINSFREDFHNIVSTNIPAVNNFLISGMHRHVIGLKCGTSCTYLSFVLYYQHSSSPWLTSLVLISNM